MPLDEPCRDCSAPADRLVGTAVLCHACAEAVLGPIRERVLDRQGYLDGCEPGTAGVGRITGRRRPDHGPDVYELRCPACGATWCGRPGDPCGWCIDLHAAIRAGQRDILLQPPDVEHSDQEYDGRMRACADRLARAVDSGLLGRDEALAVWREAVGHAGRAA